MKPRMVYFMKPFGMKGPIKIGCSNVPEHRLEQLATWSPFPLELFGKLPGEYRDEQFLHACFARSHLHREWFSYSPELRAAIDRIVLDGTFEWARKTLQPQGSIRSKVWNYPESRLYRSYRMRVIWAEKRLRKSLGENGNFSAPDDVNAIIKRWESFKPQGRVGIEPTPAEFSRLDQYLANPAAHSGPPWWVLEGRPKKAA